jgi:aldose 1-epimerase
MITLQAGAAKVQIVPQMGAGLAGLWVGDLPVLRPWSGDVAAGPFALGCNLLVPFSNRISNGGFQFEGIGQSISPNLPDEAFPVHGDGFQREWLQVDANQHSARLLLAKGEIGPFRYAATVTYNLSENGLTTQLSVTNTAASALPYGLGLHPWFPRSDATRLQFLAEGFWPETADHLPATLQPVPQDNGGDWRDLAPLPFGLINTGFSGWDGRAQIVQGPEAVSLQVTAQGLGTALLYSPSAAADFFCFEPVSHPVDAHNLPGQPGLTRLTPGQTLTASMTLTWGPTA